MLDRAGLSRASSTLTDDLDRARRRRRLRARPDPRRRPGGAARATRRSPLACGCIGQETTGAGGFAKALRTVPVVLEIAERVARARRARTPGSSTSRTRSGSSRARCSTPGTARSASATSRSASSGAFAALLGVEPARVVVDQVGLNHLTWVRARAARRRATCCRELLAEHGDELAAEVELPAPAARRARRGARRTTCATSTRTTRCSPSSSTACRAPQTVAEIERELLELYRDPALDEKPALLEQRGGAFYSEAAVGLVALARLGRRRRARGRRAQRRHARRARRRRRRRGAGARRAAAARCRCRRRRSRRSCSASSSTSPPTSGSPREAARDARPGRRRARRCSRIR